MGTPDIDLCRRWAAFYRERGFQPLPSRSDEKRPMCRFADWWERPAPADLFDRHPTTNIQVMTGRFWRLLVIDLDGPSALEEWKSWFGGHGLDTWVTHSGGDGRHLWFRIPAAYPRPLPKAFIWKGDGNHAAIERICDKSLIMAPPSIHPKTGQRYRFLSRAQSPKGIPMPADCPAWVLARAPISLNRGAFPTTGGLVGQAVRGPKSSRDWRPSQPVPYLVQSWGVRLAGKPSAKGWIPCHAIDREDRRPSAAIHAESGYYVDQGSGARMSLYDLAVSLGVYRDRAEAVASLRG